VRISNEPCCLGLEYNDRGDWIINAYEGGDFVRIRVVETVGDLRAFLRGMGQPTGGAK
jgi:hypothetical protein